jgi:hypothetical protein
MWEKLSNHLKAILEANTLLSSVYDYEEGEFNEQPVAVIVPSDSEGEFTTTLQNEEVYAFNVFLFVQIGDTFYTKKEADAVLRELVDNVKRDFDKNWSLTGLSMETGYNMLFMETAPSAWGYSSRENVYRMAELQLKVHLSVDTNLIT